MRQLSWPLVRHDLGLTGRTDGAGNIRRPEVIGELEYRHGDKAEVWVCDLNHGEQQAFVLLDGGRIRVIDRSGALLWQSEVCNPVFIGCHDLEGAGKELCIVAITHLRTIAVFSAWTGEQLWAYTFAAKTVMLLHSRLRVGAIDADLAGEQITVWPEGDEFGYLFSFEEGVRNGRLVWKNRGVGIGERSRYRTNVLIGDVRGDGKNAIVVVQHTYIYIVDCKTGEIQWEIKGPPMRNYGLAGLYDVDNDGVKELVFVNDSVQLRTSVLKWTGSGFDYLWSTYIGYGESLMNAMYRPVIDADGDGYPEIAYSVCEVATGSWHTEIVSAASGELKYRLDHVRLLDSAPDSDSTGMMLLAEDGRTGEAMLVRPHRNESVHLKIGTAELVPFLEGPRPVMTNHTNIQRGKTYLKDIDQDGKAECLVQTPSGVGWLGGEFGKFTIKQHAPAEAPVLYALEQAAGTGRYFVSGCEGQAVLINANGADGIRLGGRLTAANETPIISDVDGDGICEVLIGDSAYRWSAQQGNDAPAFIRKWTVPSAADVSGTDSAAISALAAWDFAGDGRTAVLFRGAHTELICADGGGEVLWRTKLNPGFPGGVVDSCSVGRFCSPDRYDIYANVKSTNASANESMVIDSRTGDILWRRTDGHEIGMGPVEGYAGVLPLERDGLDDLIFLSGNVLVELDGATGRSLAPIVDLSDTIGTEWVGYGQLTLVDADNDGREELYLSAIWGLNGGLLKRTESGRTPVWFDYYGQFTPIGTPPRNRHQGLAKDGLRVLAGGQRADYRFACVDAVDGRLLWQFELGDRLISDTCTGDIDGDGQDEFVFACDDGYLYALKLDGSLYFRLSVGGVPGSPVLADIDGDGRIEIVLTRSDGMLLAVK